MEVYSSRSCCRMEAATSIIDVLASSKLLKLKKIIFDLNNCSQMSDDEVEGYSSINPGTNGSEASINEVNGISKSISRSKFQSSRDVVNIISAGGEV